MSDWRSLHAFFHRPELGDALILEADRVLRSGSAPASWFFIRYAEGGPHIRVRVDAANPSLVEELRARLSRICALPRDVDVDLGWWRANAMPDPGGAAYDPGDVREIDYVPEIRRYGGADALAVNEQLFLISTSAATAAIAATLGDRGARARIALGLTIAAASALCATYAELGDFFARYGAFWTALGGEGSAALANGVAGDGMTLRNRYRSHREEIVEGIAGRTLAGKWRDAMVQANARFETLHERGLLISPLTGRRAEGREEFLAAIDSMACSQIHMLNNRLGFTPMEEAGWCDGLARLAAGS